jgi:hypothetical protein
MAISLLESEYDLLGLDRSVTFSALDHGTAPPGPAEGRVALDFAVIASLLGALLVQPGSNVATVDTAQEQQVEEQVPASRQFVDAPFEIPRIGDLVHLRVLASQPHIFMVQALAGEPYMAGPYAEHPDGFLVIDSRQGAKMRVCTDERDVLLVFTAGPGKDEPGHVAVYEIDHPASERVNRLRSMAPRTDLAIPAPDVAVPDSSPRWLRELVRNKAASESGFERALGACVVFRHAGAAVLDKARGQSLDALLAEPPNLKVRAPALRWIEDLNPSDRQLLERHAIASAQMLRADFESLDEVLEGEPERDGVVVLGMLHARDDLEALVELLAEVGAGTELRRALEAVDDAGSSQLSRLGALPTLREDERMAATAWEDPGAWWARLAQ